MININNLECSDISKPYERCLLKGPEVLSDAELIAVLIRTGSNGKNAVQLAEEILDLSASDKNILGLCHLDVRELMTVPGIGQVKAIQIKCAVELSKRISTLKAKHELSFKAPVTIAEYYYERLRHEEREVLICMMLDVKNNFVGESIITKGTISASLISVREVFLEAIRFRAVKIILVHNHPSGDPYPSQEDDDVTEQIIAAGNILEIPLLDHVIIGDKVYYSYKEQDYIP